MKKKIRRRLYSALSPLGRVGVGLLFYFIFALSPCKAQWVTIPDAGFVAQLSFSVYSGCLSGNQLDTTCPDLFIPAPLDLMPGSITDLTGIQYMHGMTELNCHSNLITFLPTLPESLEYIDCESNQITSLPPLPNTLRYLDCGNNQLISLPFLPDSLRELHCPVNNLTTLPNLPPKLNQLVCHFNQLTSLPTLPDSIWYLWCSNNLLTVLPTLPDSVSNLYCSNNFLTAIPQIKHNYFALRCDGNQISFLPDFPSIMTSVYLKDNPNLKCLPPFQAFGNGAAQFDISGTSITCLPNVIQHTFSVPGIDTMPICDVFNINECAVGWNIKGETVFDTDGDCQTINDGQGVSHIRMNLSDNSGNLIQQIIANWNGAYSFDTLLGNYFTSVDTSSIPFDVLCPTNNSVTSNLTAIDSMDYNVDFRLKCKSGFDIGSRCVINYGNFFPGNLTTISVWAGDIAKCVYNVDCNSAGSGQVKIILSGNLSYDSSMGGLTPVVNGDTLTYNVSDFSLLNCFGEFVFKIRTDSSAQIGDAICFDVSVTPTTGDNNISNNTLTHCFAVSNSFDPNEKEVSPIGDLNYPFNNWLTYTIHFQNTGTSPAQHIQILDTLDTDLDESTFQLLSSSFDPMVQLFGNKVHFNFVNINLPDSTTDAEGSKGYVSYRIKPKQNLAIGTQIENTASIYFDFNSPIVTNTTLNTILHDDFAPAVSNEFSFSIYPNPTENQLTVSSRQLSGATISITDILGRELHNEILNQPLQTINLESFSSGVYFISLRSEKFIAVKKIIVE